MNAAQLESRAYVLNLALLATHQVDAGYWHEWDLFGLPGGPALFLAFNVAAVGILALGLIGVAQGHRRASAISAACAVTGYLTCGVHAWFLQREPVPFSAPASMALFAGIAAVSTLQLLLVGAGVLARHRRAGAISSPDELLPPARGRTR